MKQQESKDIKIEQIRYHVAEIMDVLGLERKDESLKNTPLRVAKMYVNEVFSSLHEDAPKITTFPNSHGYNQMLIEKNITIYSTCEHHLVPIFGKCHIAYIPGDRVIGLSKLIRVAQYFSAKPQIQEKLTHEIGVFLQNELNTKDVAVVMDLAHFCCSMRGARDQNSTTITSFLGGSFKETEARTEFMALIR